MKLSRSSLVLVAVVIALVNLPLVQSTWTRSSVERNGVEVMADVTEARNLGSAAEPSWWLSYQLPTALDPEQATWSAEVDAARGWADRAAGFLRSMTTASMTCWPILARRRSWPPLSLG